MPWETDAMQAGSPAGIGSETRRQVLRVRPILVRWPFGVDEQRGLTGRCPAKMAGVSFYGVPVVADGCGCRSVGVPVRVLVRKDPDITAVR